MSVEIDQSGCHGTCGNDSDVLVRERPLNQFGAPYKWHRSICPHPPLFVCVAADQTSAECSGCGKRWSVARRGV